MKRQTVAALASAIGLLLVFPLAVLANVLADAAGLEDEEDAHGLEGLAVALTGGMCLLVWLLLAVTSLVEALRGGRSDGPWSWAWASILAATGLVAAAVGVAGAVTIAEGFSHASLVQAMLAGWTGVAGLVALLFFPWRSKGTQHRPASSRGR